MRQIICPVAFDQYTWASRAAECGAAAVVHLEDVWQPGRVHNEDEQCRNTERIEAKGEEEESPKPVPLSVLGMLAFQERCMKAGTMAMEEAWKVMQQGVKESVERAEKLQSLAPLTQALSQWLTKSSLPVKKAEDKLETNERTNGLGANCLEAKG